MPYVCVEKRRARAQRRRQGRHAARKIAVLGVAYKPGVGDIRESPGAEDHRAPAGARRRGRLPRRVRARAAEVRPRSAPLDEALDGADVARDRHRPPGHRPHRRSPTQHADASTSAGSPAPRARQPRPPTAMAVLPQRDIEASPRRWRHEASYDRRGPLVRRPGHPAGPAPDRRLPGRRLLRRPRLRPRRARRAAPRRRPRRRHAGGRERARPPARGRRGRPGGQGAAAHAAHGRRVARGGLRGRRPAPSSPRPSTRSRSARCCARSRSGNVVHRSAPRAADGRRRATAR